MGTPESLPLGRFSEKDSSTHLPPESSKSNSGSMAKDTRQLTPVERWAREPAMIAPYQGGVYEPPAGEPYSYPQGRNLIIAGNTVMGTCEGAWASKTVEMAFAQPRIHFLPENYKIKVLESGAGLNMTGDAFIQRFRARRAGGEYHVIELNHDVAESTRRWRAAKLNQLRNARMMYGADPDIDIIIHEGEATEVTRKLIEEDGMKFNIILSDTFPLTEEQKGVNDLQDLATIKKGLYKNEEGIFAFYPYFPGFEQERGDGFLTARQAAIMREYFPFRRTDVAGVNPPPSYTYLFDSEGVPTRRLPVVIAINQ